MQNCQARIRAAKRAFSTLPADPPLDKLGLNPEHWAHRVQGFAEGFGAKWFRVIGELEDMIEKALEIN